MKKFKRLLAAVASALLTAMPILSVPMFVNAASVEDEQVGLWVYYLDDYLVDMDEGWSGYSTNVDLEYLYLDIDAEEPDDTYINLYLSTSDYKQHEITVSYTLPVYLSNVVFTGYYYVEEAGGSDGTITSYSVSGNTFTVSGITSESGYFDVEFSGKTSLSSPLEDQFWFIPMKTQLNIAAEIASASGKEAVAEVSGNFALSYEIMKWLEDHPNVTLKYNLTYKEKDYNIVIQGGHKLANLEIPWYGPEYLIGKFSK